MSLALLETLNPLLKPKELVSAAFLDISHPCSKLRLAHLDHKCEICLYDRCTEDGSFDSITLNIFRPLDGMPDPGLGDVIVLFQAKVFQPKVGSPLSPKIVDLLC